MEKIKIILTDDHQLFRDGIKSLLQTTQHIEIVGEASKGKELLELLKQSTPDILILDITLPDLSGIEITRQVSHDYPHLKVLILSMHNEDEFVINALKAGAKGYLPKDISKHELLEAIKTIYEGEEYFSKTISETFLKKFVQRTRMGLHGENPILTPRETEIVKLVAEGLKNQQIADKLFISVRTVDAHKNNIMKKLNLKSNIDIVKFAIKYELIKL
jgi:DNA-binding NarL/FixJ family response regulator